MQSEYLRKIKHAQVWGSRIHATPRFRLPVQQYRRYTSAPKRNSRGSFQPSLGRDVSSDALRRRKTLGTIWRCSPSQRSHRDQEVRRQPRIDLRRSNTVVKSHRSNRIRAMITPSLLQLSLAAVAIASFSATPDGRANTERVESEAYG